MADGVRISYWSSDVCSSDLPDAGTILRKLATSRDSAIILNQARDADGRAGWLRVGGDQPLSEQDAEAAIEKAIRRDPDLYVIEIEDSKARILVDGQIGSAHV